MYYPRSLPLILTILLATAAGTARAQSQDGDLSDGLATSSEMAESEYASALPDVEMIADGHCSIISLTASAPVKVANLMERIAMINSNIARAIPINTIPEDMKSGSLAEAGLTAKRDLACMSLLLNKCQTG